MARTKALPRAMLEPLRARLRKEVDEEFEGKASRAAKVMGISQPHLNDILSAEGHKGVGLPVLLVLAQYFDCTLDELLGRPAATVQNARDAYRVILRAQGIDADVIDEYLSAAHEGGLGAIEPEIVLAEVRRKQREKDLGGARVRVDVRKTPPDELDQLVEATEERRKKAGKRDAT